MADENHSDKRYELHQDRLATTDETGARVYLYPEDTEGKWKDRRTFFYWFLILLYLVLPWFYIKGKPAIFIDLAHREFTFMGSTLHGVEPILMFLVLVSGLFFIAFMTSLFGRVWCGWGCPQTVFIQSIFMKIETLVEGRARQRRDLDRAPWSLNKVLRKIIKWGLFTAVSLHITHTFIGYFVGPRELFHMSMHAPGENPGVFMAVMIATGIILFDFGWFREQFCIIACPYGRMQSVLMDANSLVVAYDTKRGEPRRGQVPREQEGDCINDYACVKVCPTGIDIRRGTQLECIACTQCIDACDDIMRKVKKPLGLIRYSSEVELSGGTHKIVTPRAIIYLLICLTFIISFFFFLNRSTNLSFVFIRGQDKPFQEVVNPKDSKTILNHFTVTISHQGEQSHLLTFKVHDPNLANKIEIIVPMNQIKITVPQLKTLLFFKFDPSILVNGSRIFTMEVLDDGKYIQSQEVVLVGPTK